MNTQHDAPAMTDEQILQLAADHFMPVRLPNEVVAFARAVRAVAPLVQCVPQGWKLVPIEPTPEMIAAAFAGTIEDQDVNRQARRRQGMAVTYKAIIAASPLPAPVVQQPSQLLEAAQELIGQAEQSLDYRPEFRRAISKLQDAIKN